MSEFTTCNRLRPRPETEGRVAVWSSPLRRWSVRRLMLVARWHGLKVTHEHDGNPFYRLTLITATGDPDAVLRWVTYADPIAQSIGRWPTRWRL